ncbi:carbohydrate sulfotransferase 11-like [Homarus americanus]|uniref:carbohydrate sulfotransferase 11-like n=1 Tax=Homarus americanus TaxID=6706 RepID=UPI001C497964|nr:carbohydrate sulfotransferase 11-like [Homarus americanus]
MVCVVLKAGSTAWNALLAARYNKTDMLVTRLCYKMIKELMPSPSRFTEVAKSNEFSRILVVRHPLERLVSAYRNRLADPDIIGYQSQTYVPLILAYTRGRSYSHKEIFNVAGRIQVIPTFKEFVSFLVEEEIQEYDDHWTPISYTCGLCYINYTAIIHTETYQDDIRYIMRISGLDTKVNPELMNNYTNKANGHDTQDVLVSYYKQLEPILLRRIIEKFKLDFLLFGYDPNPLVQKIYPNMRVYLTP